MNSNNKYICIHGHFYQPPRENAWLEVVEKQDEAAPYHNWNERINFECYAPNTSARILDDSGMIRKIVNNYAQISFNMGPTLLSWLAANDSETYLSILEADEKSQLRFNGHGSALAQAYSHLIMPLANRRDKETQIKWGLADFERRFRRKAEGIWLAETAVDTETLEICAEHDIKFVPLAPRQAKAFRKIGEENWTSLGHAQVDPRRPYLYKLPSGKSIVLYFYDGNVAQDVAFKGLLNDGRGLAQRLIQAIDNDDKPQLVHIGTDGESYGHHHRHGEMALAACYDHIEENDLATLTNYGEYLELFPPEYEIQIHENSSWSCVHGVERWRSNCGCNTGGQDGWNQTWRAPLRDSLDWLRDKLIPIFEKEASQFFEHPWAARDAYIQVILDRKKDAVDAFFKEYATRELSAEEEVKSLRLLEMQRHAMLMYTSCAWFFSEVSGIETIQVLQYANRAIHYAQQVSGADFHPKFI
jgi:alpha-amylase/alpha-mannosidase (GH57 family)